MTPFSIDLTFNGLLIIFNRLIVYYRNFMAEILKNNNCSQNNALDVCFNEVSYLTSDLSDVLFGYFVNFQTIGFMNRDDKL